MENVSKYEWFSCKYCRICNKEKNVFGLMPHPERAIEELLGSTDGVIC